jgi:hypothetical protein
MATEVRKFIMPARHYRLEFYRKITRSCCRER